MADLAVFQMTEQTLLADDDLAYNSPLITATRRDRFVQKSNERRYHALVFQNVQSLSAGLTISSTSAFHQFLNPNGADRTITLDASLEVAGRAVRVKHTGTANLLNVVNSGATAQGAGLSVGQTAIYTYSGTAWIVDLVSRQRVVVQIMVSDPRGIAISVADDWAVFRVPSELNGWNLVGVAASVTTVSSSGIPTIQIRNFTDSVDMLSTKLTIDASETDSATAAVPAVIDTAVDDVAMADSLRVDVDVAGTGTKGLTVQLIFQRP